MKKIILSLTFICFSSAVAVAQYDSIPQSEIASKIQEIKNGSLKDSIFWSCVGLFDVLKYDFSSLFTYKIYVSNQGLYFELNFKDKLGNISVSGMYFVPHIRKETDSTKVMTSVFAPNEHFCRCTAKVGFAMVQKKNKGFTCIGAIPEYDTDDNIDVECQDTQAKQIFFRKYYEKGLNREEKLNLIEPEILPFSEE